MMRRMGWALYLATVALICLTASSLADPPRPQPAPPSTPRVSHEKAQDERIYDASRNAWNALSMTVWFKRCVVERTADRALVLRPGCGR